MLFEYKKEKEKIKISYGMGNLKTHFNFSVVGDETFVKYVYEEILNIKKIGRSVPSWEELVTVSEFFVRYEEDEEENNGE